MSERIPATAVGRASAAGPSCPEARAEPDGRAGPGEDRGGVGVSDPPDQAGSPMEPEPGAAAARPGCGRQRLDRAGRSPLDGRGGGRGGHGVHDGPTAGRGCENEDAGARPGRPSGRALHQALAHPVLAVTGLAFAFASLAAASNGLAAWPAALAAASVAAVTPALWLVDVREHRLPNPLTGSAAIGCALALLLALVPGAVGVAGAEAGGVALPAALGALTAAAVAALVFGALALTGGMGMGDAKLAPSLAVAAALLSLETALAAFALAFLAGGVAAIGRLVARRDRRERLAFGPYLLGGFWAAWAVAVVS